MSAEKKAQEVSKAVKAVESQIKDLQKALIAPGSVRAAVTTSGSPEGVSVADLSKQKPKTLRDLPKKAGPMKKGIMSSIVAREAASMGAPKKPSEPTAKLPTASRHAERANSYQSAMSGAFTPKGPMTPSGLELDRPKPKMPAGPRLNKAMTADMALNKTHKATLRSLLDRLSKGCAKAMAASESACEPQVKHNLKSLLSKLSKKAAKTEPEVLSHQPTAHQEQTEVVKKSADNLKNLLSKLKK